MLGVTGSPLCCAHSSLETPERDARQYYEGNQLTNERASSGIFRVSPLLLAGSLARCPRWLVGNGSADDP